MILSSKRSTAPDKEMWWCWHRLSYGQCTGILGLPKGLLWPVRRFPGCAMDNAQHPVANAQDSQACHHVSIADAPNSRPVMLPSPDLSLALPSPGKVSQLCAASLGQPKVSIHAYLCTYHTGSQHTRPCLHPPTLTSMHPPLCTPCIQASRHPHTHTHPRINLYTQRRRLGRGGWGKARPRPLVDSGGEPSQRQ